MRRMTEKIMVKLHIREGEYGSTGRFEFPSNEYIFRILESAMEMEEQKRHHFYFFNNILVSRRYSEDVKTFLVDVARKAGFEIEFEEG